MIQHTPLDVTTMSASAQRALGPGPGKMMAARGIMPLAATDQLAVLYQLALDEDTSIAETARKTAVGLPEKILDGALRDPKTDPRVLDFFADGVLDKAGAFDAIMQNPATADATFATLAGRADAKQVDRIAENEKRLLRHPEIIAAMYMNRRARMSTIDRVVELAVRNNVRVPGLAAWEEVAKALIGGGASNGQDDAVFASLPADDGSAAPFDPNAVPPEEQPFEDDDVDSEGLPRSVSGMIRCAFIGPKDFLPKLIRKPFRLVRDAVMKSPKLQESEVLKWASNANMAEDVIQTIASNREWTKGYAMKAVLCRNPKTPIGDATRFLPFLRERELQQISKSKSIPSAMSAQAKKLLMSRTGSKK